MRLDISHMATLDLWGDIFNAESVKAIWWRQKPNPIVPGSSASALYDYYFQAKEWNHLQEFIGMEFNEVYALNPRASAARANNKILQLRVATKYGFEVPRTLVSNNSDAVSFFIGEHSGKSIVFKTMTPYMGPTGLVTYTTIIEHADVENFKFSLRKAPGIFQHYVEKEYELRITVVGEDIFAAKINSRESANAQVDWRKSIFDDIYEKYSVSADFQRRLLALHREFGLIYGAYDFIIKPGGEPVFLEVNPSGQWMWLEEMLGFPISEKIAKLLVAHKKQY